MGVSGLPGLWHLLGSQASTSTYELCSLSFSFDRMSFIFCWLLSVMEKKKRKKADEFRGPFCSSQQVQSGLSFPIYKMGAAMIPKI